MSAQIFGPLVVHFWLGLAAHATAPLKPKAAKTTSAIAIPNLGMLLSSLLRVLLPLANEVSRRVRDDMLRFFMRPLSIQAWSITPPR
jgi:hypothetical protein